MKIVIFNIFEFDVWKNLYLKGRKYCIATRKISKSEKFNKRSETHKSSFFMSSGLGARSELKIVQDADL